MKFLMIGALLGMMANSYAGDWAMFGETKDCELQVKVLSKLTDTEDFLLVIHEQDIYELELKQTLESGVKNYASIVVPEGEPLGKMTFEATIIPGNMEEASDLHFFLSGRDFACDIQKI